MWVDKMTLFDVLNYRALSNGPVLDCVGLLTLSILANSRPTFCRWYGAI